MSQNRDDGNISSSSMLQASGTLLLVTASVRLDDGCSLVIWDHIFSGPQILHPLIVIPDHHAFPQSSSCSRKADVTPGRAEQRPFLAGQLRSRQAVVCAFQLEMQHPMLGTKRCMPSSCLAASRCSWQLAGA